MDNSKLRGFCQKCEWQIYYSEKEKRAFHFIPIGLDYSKEYKNCQIEPVWFLSPSQIEIISIFFHKQTKLKSHSFGDILEAQNLFQETEYGKWANWIFDEFDAGGILLINYMALLSESPFLVAKILKESESK